MPARVRHDEDDVTSASRPGPGRGQEYDDLDAALAGMKADRSRRRAEAKQRQVAQADFHRRFREWAEVTAAPTLEAIADHVHELDASGSVHVHHPDVGAGHRDSVDLNVRVMGHYVQLSFRARLPQRAVGISENHGAEVTEDLESLTDDSIRRRAIAALTRALAGA